MNDVEPPSSKLPGFLKRRPTLQYVLLALIGVFGLYLAMPIALGPQSPIEWIDLIINLVILLASGALAIGGGTLAVVSRVSPNTLDDESRPARFTRMIVRIIGIPRALQPDIATLGPLGLLVQILWERPRQPSLPSTTDSDDDADL